MVRWKLPLISSAQIFPDSLSKTIPIWCCVLNHIVADFMEAQGRTWDRDLHLPAFISESEKAQIEVRALVHSSRWDNETLSHDLLMVQSRIPILLKKVA